MLCQRLSPCIAILDNSWKIFSVEPQQLEKAKVNYFYTHLYGTVKNIKE